jgi:hypothetical protein
MKHANVTYYLLLALGIATTSCMTDDLSSCSFENRVLFDYMPASGGRVGINPDDVDIITLYAFDENGGFVKKYTDNSPALSPDYSIAISDLPVGKYRFAAWGNLGAPYSVTSVGRLDADSGSIDNLTVMLDIDNGLPADTLHPLFFAGMTGTDPVELPPLASRDIRLKLVQDTYRNNISAAGLDSMNANRYVYRAFIVDNNGAYGFDNAFADCDSFRYAAQLVPDPEDDFRLGAHITVLRLSESRPKVRMELVNESLGITLADNSLIDLIRAANKMGAEVDFDNTHTFDVIFVFDPSSPLQCSVYVNGYKVIDQDGIILN